MKDRLRKSSGNKCKKCRICRKKRKINRRRLFKRPSKGLKNIPVQADNPLMLKIYNTLTRKIENFKPIDPDKVGIYTCGPTVYRQVHIGNFRTYIGADILRRVLMYNDFRVIHIKNITDVGHMRRMEEGEEQIDPVIEEALREGKTPSQIAERFTKLFLEDEKKLNILPATVYPKATDHIKEMIEIIKIL